MPKILWSLLACSAMSFAFGVPATAGEYPVKPVRLVVPASAGGPADAIGRTIASALSSRLGQQVVVENKPGASGAIGVEAVARSQPDGYTLLVNNITDSIVAALGIETPYDFVADLQPIGLLGRTPFVVVVGASVPVNSVGELIALGRASPAGMTYGSAGTGSASHLSGALFASMAKTKAVHIPYKGQAPATTDLAGGHLTFMFNNPVTSLPLISNGTLRALAVSGPTRFKKLPDVPTVAEGGLPGFDVTAWFGLMAPAGTPRSIVDRLNRESVEALKSPDVVQALEARGVEPTPTTPEEYAALIRSEIDRWRKVASDADIASVK